MTKKIITWVDPEGRYRVTSPAYGDPTNPLGETEDETIARVLVKLKARYGLSDTHILHFVEDADQRARLVECCGVYFRYAGIPDTDGKRDGRDGAWEMDTDGRPKVNMAKARLVQMDYIRVERNKSLEQLDNLQIRAVGRGDDTERARLEQEKQTLRDLPQTFALAQFSTPETLKAAWPTELPARTPI